MIETKIGLVSIAIVAIGCSSAKPSHERGALPVADAAAPDGSTTLPPIPGTTRFSLTMDTFTIGPNQEFYKCQDFPNPAGKDIAILRSVSSMTRGSHHMFAFRIASDTLNLADGGSKGPLVDCPSGGVEFHPYFHDAQIPERVITYPEGVGRSLKSTEGVRLMVHYLNPSSESLSPSLTVTADYVDASAVSALAAEYFLSGAGVVVKPGHSTQTFSYALPSDVHVLSAVSHMHRHGVGFEAEALAPGATDAGGGHVLYETTDWIEPKPDDFAPALDVSAGTVFRFTCTYDNNDGQTFTFGESALKNEMCIFQGTYYPSADGNGIVPLILSASQ